jgi:hypothetical protein
LQLLTDLDLATCQDSSIKAAMTQLAQQLVMPHTLQQLSSNASNRSTAGVVDGTTCSSSHTAESEDSRSAGAVQASTAAGGQSSSAADGTAALQLLEQLLQDMLTVQGSEHSDAAGDEGSGEGQWLSAALERFSLGVATKC